MSPTITAMIMPVLCTIFAVSQDETYTYFETAAHCTQTPGQIVLCRNPENPQRSFEARVIEKDAHTDTALLKAWTKDVGPVTVRPKAMPQTGPAIVPTHRGTLRGPITEDAIQIQGLTPRQIIKARVIPGDSGSPVVQDEGIVGTITHSVGDCYGGFCPSPQSIGNKLLTRELIEGDPLSISLRDILAALAGIFGFKWWTKPPQKPNA